MSGVRYGAGVVHLRVETSSQLVAALGLTPESFAHQRFPAPVEADIEMTDARCRMRLGSATRFTDLQVDVPLSALDRTAVVVSAPAVYASYRWSRERRWSNGDLAA